MKGEIIKIMPEAYSRNGNTFTRVMIKLSNMDIAFADLCPDYRNFKNWKPYLKVGTRLAGLDLISKKKVNADSLIYLPDQKRLGHWEENKETNTMKWVDDNFIEEKNRLNKLDIKQKLI
jgi:hypothetical protein